jgi:UPF0755 protein
MSDEHGFPGGDPFIDPNDHDAVEREQRRREREAKRAGKASKRKQKEAAAPPPPPKEPPPPTRPRTPEQEFWDEPAEPVTPPPLPVPEPGGEPRSSAPAERGRKRLLGRRKAKRAAAAGAAAAGGAAAADAASGAPAGPPTGESPAPQQPAPPTSEQPAAAAGPPTGETPVPPQPPPTSEQPAAAGPPTGEEPIDAGPPTAEQPVAPPTGEQPIGGGAPPTAEEPVPDPGPPTGEGPIADPGPPTAEQALPEPIPSETEAPHALAAETPQADPGPGTAETPQLDPNQPRREQVPLPVPVEQTGAGDWEPPPPRDDWGFDEDEDFHDDGDPNMAGAARVGRRHGEGDNRRGGFLGALLRHPFRILATVVLILILIFLNALFQPFVGEGHGKVVVDIPKGSSVGEVGDLLEKKGVISDGFVVSGSTLFQARVTIAGKRSDLFAGKFTMKEGMSYGDAIDELSKEPKPAEAQSKPGIVTVTIPEGQSRPITAKLVKEDGVKGNYLKASKKSKILNPEKYGGKNVKNLEGFLFPDTWEFKTNKPVKDLVALQLEDFKKQIKKVNMKYAKSKNLTVYDVVTIASIIEREAAVPKQRKLVASVIYNRLHEGMTLGMDSTIRFATGNYEKPLTESELESSSPYNTRNHAGLPPGPINSPGLAAINAAAHPAKTEFLFFVNNPNSCNELAFAKTEEEFLANEAKYQKAREANGGNQPTTCK